MLVLALATASDRLPGKLKDLKLNITFHGRRVPRPAFTRSLAREMYSSFVEVPGEEELGIVP